MTALVCKRCGCAGSDLDPQCRSCGGSLPGVSNDLTLRSVHDDAVGSDRASRIGETIVIDPVRRVLAAAIASAAPGISRRVRSGR